MDEQPEQQQQPAQGRRYVGSIHAAAAKFLPSEQRGEGNVYGSRNALHMRAALEAEQHRVTADFLVRAIHDLKGEGHDPEFVENMDRLVELWQEVRPRVSAS